MGIEIFDRTRNSDLTWDSLAGYDKVKNDMEETVVNALKYPEVYDEIATKTRVMFESNRPKAILLEGPPGTGKTLTARILASRCERPLVHLKLEHFVSKWYGDSEKKLSKVL
jgi:SpoVK/Ycf46/Vps4 family AAA+-type ATPase